MADDDDDDLHVARSLESSVSETPVVVIVTEFLETQPCHSRWVSVLMRTVHVIPSCGANHLSLQSLLFVTLNDLECAPVFYQLVK